MADIRELAQRAQAIAERSGIRKFDISGSAVDETSVQVDRGEPKQVKASNRSGLTVRVWNDEDRVGITSTTDLDEAGIELALKTAAEASAFGVTEHAPDFSPEALTEIDGLKTEHLPQAAAAKLIETLVDAEKQLLEAHPAIAGVPYNGLAQRDVDRFYLNSDGALRYEGGSYASVYLFSKTEEEGRKPRSAGAVRMSHSLDDLNIQACVDEATTKTISHLNYEKVTTGQYRVVFSADAFLSLLGAFSNMFNAQSILDKRSLSTAESLGTQIASPLLSVYDDVRNSQNISASYFDGEGTPTRRVPLIVDGVLTNFLHSAGTAKRMSAHPTGHANIGAKVSVSPDFGCVIRGKAADSDYSLDQAENVILIDDLRALHAGVKSLEGSFSLPFDGWVVNKGDRVSIESATIAGDIRTVLNSIVYVEAEPELVPGNGLCPRIWVDGLSVTGE
ncbi:MAG: TldD/PmbA family protein [Cyanobacteria bacterium J06642_2]